MIDVEQRALRPLQKHRRAAPYRPMDREADVVGERKQTLGESLEHRNRLRAAHTFLAAEAGELRLGVCRALLDELMQSL